MGILELISREERELVLGLELLWLEEDEDDVRLEVGRGCLDDDDPMTSTGDTDLQRQIHLISFKQQVLLYKMLS